MKLVRHKKIKTNSFLPRFGPLFVNVDPTTTPKFNTTILLWYETLRNNFIQINIRNYSSNCMKIKCLPATTTSPYHYFTKCLWSQEMLCPLWRLALSIYAFQIHSNVCASDGSCCFLTNLNLFQNNSLKKFDKCISYLIICPSKN